MERKNLSKIIALGAITAVINFVLFFIGIKYVLVREINTFNIGAFLILSLIIGALSAAFFSIKPRAGFYLFELGLLLGFIVMYNAFLKDLNGWEDFSGIVSFFMLVIGGLLIGIIVQASIYIYKRKKDKKLKSGK